ncbi:hypothetical protein [Acinetobacter sp. ANC 4640]
MGIQNFPAALQPIIQQGFLEREFQTGLQSRLGFRAVADREEIPNQVGETVTKTRRGLKAPTTTPLNPSNNTNIDNGLTASGWTVEQYTLNMNMYGDTIDLNMVTQGVGIAKQFMQNAMVNGVQATQSLDRLARDALFGSYLGGNTRVKTTLGAPATTVAVDDIRGFQHVLVNGVKTPVSPSATNTVTIGASSYTLTGATADGTNTSTTPNGVSGTLTLSGNVSVSDGTAGNTVQAATAPSIFRPSNKGNTSNLISTDLLTMQLVLNAVAQLRANNVPTINGKYHCYLDDYHLLELFQDADFKLLYRGAYGSEAYRNGQVIELLGVLFIPTTEAYQQKLSGLSIRRAIVCGQGALVEGDFASTGYSDIGDGDSLKSMIDGICMVTREPLDRLQQIIAQSWYWIGGFAVPTDATANTSIIQTASNSYFKRAVVLESA